VHYYSADVKDEEQFTRLTHEVYRAFGRLDGVIHGAGIIEDKLLEDKSPDSLDRVLDTKADSAFLLCKQLREQPLRFVIFFTSVAGAFGNRGQSDYAAANEVVNSIAWHFAGATPGMVRAVNWGPWSATGMAVGGAEQEFARRGVQLISPDEGCRMMVQELENGSPGSPLVVIGGGPWKT
jgi:NAD(P)-dependent dehydrogenase (short-subunit alcohol dehydrogenase family)